MTATMMTRKKVLSTSKQAREARNAKILKLYPQLRDQYTRALDLYMEIGKRVKCSHDTVMKVLKDNGVITSKTQQP